MIQLYVESPDRVRLWHENLSSENQILIRAVEVKISAEEIIQDGAQDGVTAGATLVSPEPVASERRGFG